ncbi:MAG TPA: hypothetical protein VG273_08995 [Bryobacteraceae bacterium]|nr:hypothetical protein [Bryobacteraceae bacterium]
MSSTLARILLAVAWVCIAALLALVVKVLEIKRKVVVCFVGLVVLTGSLGGLEVWATLTTARRGIVGGPNAMLSASAIEDAARNGARQGAREAKERNPAPSPSPSRSAANPLEHHTPERKLMFSNSPLFNDATKARIQIECDKVCRYLTGFGFPVPAEFPLIRVLKIDGYYTLPSDFFMLTTLGSWSRDLDLQSSIGGGLTLSEGLLDNRKFLFAPFMQYTLEHFKWSVSRDPDEFVFLGVLMPYLVSSYADTYPLPGPQPDNNNRPFMSILDGRKQYVYPWSDALWDIRSVQGKDFTDRLVIKTLEEFSNNIDVSRFDPSDFDRRIFARLSLAVRTLSNDPADLWKYIQILSRHEINVMDKPKL